MKIKIALSMVTIFAGFLCCNSINDDKETIDEGKVILSGKIVDINSKFSVTNAKVSLLEKGPEKMTGANGEFSFTDKEILASQNITEMQLDSLIKNVPAAVSVSCTGFFPKEQNLEYSKTATIEIIPDSLKTYFYQKPVQLSDGLTAASFKEANMDSALIQQMMNKIKSGGYKQLHSILIYRNDKLVLEEYFFGNNDTIQFENNIARDRTPASIQWNRNQKHYVASVNKALTSTIVGIALDKYGKSVNDKVSSYLPDYSSYFTDAAKNNVTIKHCLTMSLGFKWDEWTSNDLALMWKSNNFTDFLLSRSNGGPNSTWVYNSASPNLLLRCMENLVGGSIRKFADDNFYKKLGITDYNWQSQPGGLPEGAARMFIRPRDMLKIGATYLNNGVWNGEQVIPAAWVTECSNIKKITSSGNYSYFFWLRSLNGTKYISADGDGGNYINIFPTKKMVVVITQGNYLEHPLYFNQANDLMENYIIPAAK